MCMWMTRSSRTWRARECWRSGSAQTAQRASNPPSTWAGMQPTGGDPYSTDFRTKTWTTRSMTDSSPCSGSHRRSRILRQGEFPGQVSSLQPTSQKRERQGGSAARGYHGQRSGDDVGSVGGRRAQGVDRPGGISRQVDVRRDLLGHVESVLASPQELQGDPGVYFELEREVSQLSQSTTRWSRLWQQASRQSSTNFLLNVTGFESLLISELGWDSGRRGLNDDWDREFEQGE